MFAQVVLIEASDRGKMEHKDSLVKFIVGTYVWLIPSYIVTAEFRAAIDKLNSAKHGETIEWSEAERSAYEMVTNHPASHIPFLH